MNRFLHDSADVDDYQVSNHSAVDGNHELVLRGYSEVGTAIL